MPAADSRPTVRMDRSTPSHDSVTCGGSPEVSSTAFDAQPPDLPPVCLVEVGFAVICQLAPHRRPHHPVLVHRLAPLIHASFRPRLATTPLRFSSPSPPPGWAEDFHPPSCRTCSAHKTKTAWPSATQSSHFAAIDPQKKCSKRQVQSKLLIAHGCRDIRNEACRWISHVINR